MEAIKNTVPLKSLNNKKATPQIEHRSNSKDQAKEKKKDVSALELTRKLTSIWILLCPGSCIKNLAVCMLGH